MKLLVRVLTPRQAGSQYIEGDISVDMYTRVLGISVYKFSDPKSREATHLAGCEF